MSLLILLGLIFSYSVINAQKENPEPLDLTHIKSFASLQQTEDYRHPVTNPPSPVLLEGDGFPGDPYQINFFSLPKILSEHVVISDVRSKNGFRLPVPDRTRINANSIYKAIKRVAYFAHKSQHPDSFLDPIFD